MTRPTRGDAPVLDTPTHQSAERLDRHPQHQSTPIDQYCQPPTSLDRLAPVRRARALALGRWLVAQGGSGVTFGEVLREYVTSWHGWRRGSNTTRAEATHAINDLELAGAVRVEPFDADGELDIRLLPPLYGLTRPTPEGRGSPIGAGGGA